MKRAKARKAAVKKKVTFRQPIMAPKQRTSIFAQAYTPGINLGLGT